MAITINIDLNTGQLLELNQNNRLAQRQAFIESKKTKEVEKEATNKAKKIFSGANLGADLTSSSSKKGAGGNELWNRVSGKPGARRRKVSEPHPVLIFRNVDQSPFPGFQLNGNGNIQVYINDELIFTAEFLSANWPKVYIIGWDVNAIQVVAAYLEYQFRNTVPTIQNCTETIVGYHDVPDVRLYAGPITQELVVEGQTFVKFYWQTEQGGNNVDAEVYDWKAIELYDFYYTEGVLIKGGKNLPIREWTCTAQPVVAVEEFYEIIPAVVKGVEPPLWDPQVSANIIGVNMKVYGPVADFFYSANIQKPVVVGNEIYNITGDGFEFPEGEEGELFLTWEFSKTAANNRYWPLSE